MVTQLQRQRAVLEFAMMTDKDLAAMLATSTPAQIIAALRAHPRLHVPAQILNDSSATAILTLMKNGVTQDGMRMREHIAQIAGLFSTDPGAYPDPSSHDALVNDILSRV